MGRDAGACVRLPMREAGQAWVLMSRADFTPRGAGSMILAILFVAIAAFGPVPSGIAADSLPRPTDRPFVTGTIPVDGEMGVPLYQPIVAYFSDQMNASNYLVRILPGLALTARWMNSNWTLALTHATDFTPCTTYWVFVDGVDVTGESLLVFGDAPVPNPWTFTTACPVFAITRTDPADGDADLPVGSSYEFGRAIVVWFSRAADPATFDVTLGPAVPLTPVWSNGDAKVTLHHSAWFRDCALHTVTVSARDRAGNPLTNATGSVPNPWFFTTRCLPPQVLATDPANGSTNVDLFAPIVVSFSEPMNRTSVNWSVSPGASFTSDWTDDDKTLTLVHTSPFGRSTTYAVAVSGEDRNGEGLGPGPAPNPWSFTTAATNPGPTGLHVARTPPHLTLTWDAAFGATSYLVYSSPDKFAPWPWPRLREVTTVSFIDDGADADGAPHYYIVRAKDSLGEVTGNSTMGAKVPLTFEFDAARTNVYWMSLPYRSQYATAKDISDALTAANIDVVGMWDPASGRSALWFYLRGAWRGTDFPLAPGDAFFLGVLADFTWIVNGTDGPAAHPFAPHALPGGDTCWVSLPFTSPYARASDVVADIEGGLGPAENRFIVEVARWDPVGDRIESFAWTPTGWGGTDFRLAVGEALFLRVVSTFAWTPNLITPEAP